MSKSKTLERTAEALPPMQAPVATNIASDLRASDMVLSRVYFGQGLTELVKTGAMRDGQAAVATSKDDPDPIIVIEDPHKDSFVCYILALEKGASFVRKGMVERSDDPIVDRHNPAHRDKWETWDFLVAIPDVDPMLPIKMRLWRMSGMQAARAICTLIARQARSGNMDPVCIRISRKETRNRDGNCYWMQQAAPGTPTPEGLEVAREMLSLVSDMQAARETENDAPVEVSDQPAFE